MESNVNVSESKMDSKKFDFPPGFRFHPTDVELINHYLVKKVHDNSFSAIAIAEVDMNKCEPWDLPELAKMGETEWYYFCVRDKKYSTGQRTNRATTAGYWKATGRDKEIFDKNLLIGMKKALVFYEGRAPSGVKTSWIMHEYRLEGNTLSKDILSERGTGEWVISRIYKKESSEKKMCGPKHGKFNSSIEEPSNTNESNLMDSSPYTNGEFSYVINSFTIPNQTQDNNIVGNNEASIMNISTSSKQIGDYPFVEETQNHFVSQEQSMMSMQLENENYGSSSKQSLQHEFSFGRDLDADISSVVYGDDMFSTWYGNQELLPDFPAPAPVVNDSLWNY
ncbi:unnamed protein product [Lathyrus sativus]|nr:unnamed protein product [Lathyrus sativus]